MSFKMNFFDACKILGINGEVTPEIVKTAYRRACSKFHPDRNPAGLEMMKLVNAAYEILKDHTGNYAHSADADDLDYGDLMNAALAVAMGCVGCKIEVMGTWIWVTGDTRANKEALKTAGFFWSKNKLAWYFRPSDFKSASHGNWSLDDIRSSYGSTEHAAKQRPALHD